MSALDLAQFLVQGKGRDSVDGFHPQFSSSLAAMIAAAPPELRTQLQIASGYRSPERQAQLWAEALKKYGSEAAARKWVAPPGRSQHNHGNAADLRYLSPAAKQWAHANAKNFGLAFPLSNEDWHIELASARGHAPHNTSPSVPAPAGQPPLAPSLFPHPSSDPVMPMPGAGGTSLASLFGGIGTSMQTQQPAQDRKQRLQALFTAVDPWAQA